MATHRFHNSDRNDFFGIGQTQVVDGKSLIGVNDALNNGSVDADKALASIPSMFARPRFMQTAFTHCKFRGETVSTYDRIVSKTLDLLEDIFYANEDDYKFEPFIIKEQIDALTRDTRNLEGHKRLAAVLQRELANIDNVETIFLIKNRQGQYVGGTSPFSIVYPSPAYNGRGTVQGLISRSDDFKRFMYRYYLAVLHQNQANTPFWVYVGNAKDADDISVEDAYTLNQLRSAYEVIETPFGDVLLPVMADVSLPVCHVRPADFSSQLFIEPTVEDLRQSFNRNDTPIILPTTNPANKTICGKIFDPTSLRGKEKWSEDNDSHKREIPGQTARHSWMSQIDFFEDELLIYPTSIASDKFVGIHKLKNGESYVLPPLRSKFFKYFKIEDIASEKLYTENGNQLTVSLSIPVCDENQESQGTVTIQKTYRIPSIAMPTFDVAIAPFCRCSNNTSLNTYHVMLLHTTECSDASKQKLSFFRDGNSIKVSAYNRSKLDKQHEGTTYYEVNDFNHIEVEIDGVRGRLIPAFDENHNGKEDLGYAVDFGTTNTNIAYKSRSDKGNFDSKILEEQVLYLNKGESSKIVNDEFFPIDTPNFPIRTVVGSRKLDNGAATILFGDASIGFNYQREKFGNANGVNYMADMKWRMQRKDDETQGRGELYLKQLLWMIKNHWMKHSSEAETQGAAPKIVLTFPDTDTQDNLMTIWERLYNEIFTPNKKVEDLLLPLQESLAPCLDETSTHHGFLNIDIGGGTTDIQYKQSSTCYYNSIRFAADDIWGDGYEHEEGSKLEDNVIKNRNENTVYRQWSKQILKDKDKLDVPDSTETRELMAYMFKKYPKEVKDAIGKDTNQNKESNEKRRKPMFLHFAALMYHVANWLKQIEAPIPSKIQFSGMGSGYLIWLLKDERLKEFVIRLLCVYSGVEFKKIEVVERNEEKIISLTFEHSEEVSQELEVVVEHDVAEAKKKTAIGALGRIGSKITYNPQKCITGVETNVIMNGECLDFDSFKKKYWSAVSDSLQACISGYNKVAGIINNQVGNDSQSCPQLNWNAIKRDADTSFDCMADAKKSLLQSRGVTESMFIWALKDVIWREY